MHPLSANHMYFRKFVTFDAILQQFRKKIAKKHASFQNHGSLLFNIVFEIKLAFPQNIARYSWFIYISILIKFRGNKCCGLHGNDVNAVQAICLELSIKIKHHDDIYSCWHWWVTNLMAKECSKYRLIKNSFPHGISWGWKPISGADDIKILNQITNENLNRVMDWHQIVNHFKILYLKIKSNIFLKLNIGNILKYIVTGMLI